MHALPDYGIHAPGVVRAFAIGGAVLLFGGTITAFLLQNSQLMTSRAFFRAGLWWGSCRLLTATILFGSSRVGKLRVRDRLMGSLHWTGEEQVLDVGCGSGLALIGAAKRLTTGRATGVDIWSAEGVLDRVKLRTGDARDLPFPSASFDTVVSMTVIHRIKDPAERQTALREMLRV